MPPRYNPAALAKTYTDILSAGIVRERPAWLPALELYPPGPAPTRSLTPEMTFRDPEAKQPSKTPLFPSRNMSRRQGGKLMAREVQQRPPRIRYPEDELRRKFYGEHPFELVVRPATLVEEEAELRKRVMKVWDGVEGGELNAEAVVKHALHLKATGMSLKDAYVQAVKAFRVARAKEEKEELELLKAYGVADAKPAVEKFQALEKAHLEAYQKEYRERPRQGQRGGMFGGKRF